jgi:hypothetical protein
MILMSCACACAMSAVLALGAVRATSTSLHEKHSIITGVSAPAPRSEIAILFLLFDEIRIDCPMTS